MPSMEEDMKVIGQLLTEEQRKSLFDQIPDYILQLAYIYATNFALYGFDITEKWETATQQVAVLDTVKAKERYYAMRHFFDGVDQQRLSNTIVVLETEKTCVERNIKGCDRDCAHCDLVLPDQKILDGYDHAIGLLSGMVR